jgi:hypothetical protein
MEQRHGYLLEASALEASALEASALEASALEASALEASALEASAGSEPDHTSALPATEPTAPEPSS